MNRRAKLLGGSTGTWAETRPTTLLGQLIRAQVKREHEAGGAAQPSEPHGRPDR